MVETFSSLFSFLPSFLPSSFLPSSTVPVTRTRGAKKGSCLLYFDVSGRKSVDDDEDEDDGRALDDAPDLVPSMVKERKGKHLFANGLAVHLFMSPLDWTGSVYPSIHLSIPAHSFQH